MNLARSGFKLLIAKLLAAVVSFLGITYFARELGSSDLGVFFLFQALVGILSIPLDFGIRGALSKRLSEGRELGETLSTAILLKMGFLLPLLAVVYLFRAQINAYIGGDLWVYLLIALVIKELALLTMDLLKGGLRVGDTALPQAGQKFVFVGVGILLVMVGFGVLGAVYGLIFGYGVMFILGVYRSSIVVGRPTMTTARSLLDYSKYDFISSVGGYMYNWMDIVIIGLFLTQADVGVYEVSCRVTIIVMLVSQSISTTIFPQVSQWDAAGARERIEAMLPRAIAPVVMLVIPAFVGTALLSEEILGLVFGPEYIAGSIVLVILMAEKVIQSVHLILGRSLKGINKPDLAASAGLVAIIINLILNLVLVPLFGIVGAAVATAVSFVVNSTLHAYFLHKFIDIVLPIKEIVGSTAASLAMAGILLAVKSTFVIDTVLRLALVTVFGVIVYMGASMLIPSLRAMIFRHANNVLAK